MKECLQEAWRVFIFIVVVWCAIRFATYLLSMWNLNGLF